MFKFADCWFAREQSTQRLALVALFQVQDEGQTAHAETLDIQQGRTVVGPWSDCLAWSENPKSLT